jgi:hypothetical protein
MYPLTVEDECQSRSIIECRKSEVVGVAVFDEFCSAPNQFLSGISEYTRVVRRHYQRPYCRIYEVPLETGHTPSQEK